MAPASHVREMAPAEVHVALPERVPVLQVMVGLVVSAMDSDAAEQTPPLVTAHVTAQSENACGVAQRHRWLWGGACARKGCWDEGRSEAQHVVNAAG